MDYIILSILHTLPCNFVSPVDDQDLYNMIEVLQKKRDKEKEMMATKITRIIAAVGLSEMYVL